MKSKLRKLNGAITALLCSCALTSANAHHSFAMYDQNKTLVMTGVVVRLENSAAHLQIQFAPLNDQRTEVLRDAQGEPWMWSVEMEGAGAAAQHGISINTFPRGTVVSLALHPLRDGRSAGTLGNFGIFRCPMGNVPKAGQHCNSVAGATSYYSRELPMPTEEIQAPASSK